MLVVHGFWAAADGLCLWAEDSERRVKSPSQALRSARPHPFAVPADTLAAIHAGKPGEAVLLLPSLRSAPLDSPELIRVTPRPPARSAPTLLPWAVPVVTFDAGAALTVLSRPAEGIRYGASLHHLGEVALFAHELVERGRVLPGVERGLDGGGAVARWRPVVRGQDVLAVRGLVAAMPPVCRAVPGRDDPHGLVTAMLGALVDAAVRERLPVRGLLVPPRRGRRPQQLPALEAWLAALSGQEGRFDADDDDVAALASALQPWDGVGTRRAGDAQATFRLTEVASEPGNAIARGEPGEPDRPGQDDQDAASRWRIEFLLQSVDDPSLLVPAAQVWADDGGLRAWLARPQESLLAELGRASRIYPALTSGLRQARPTGVELDVEGTYRFLSTAAAELSDAGFGVLLPSWWDRRAKLGLKLSASTPTDGVVARASLFGKDQLMEFRWQLAVGDDALTDEEMAALAETKAPLVQLRGQWVAIDRDQLERGLAFLKGAPEGTRTAAELLSLAGSHPDDLDLPLPVSGVEADGWLGELLDGTIARSLEPLPAPHGFQADLRPYQQRGLSWLAFLASLGLGACLADDMGLGKTVQLLALEVALRAEAPEVGPTLLVCPMSVVGNWQREAARFSPALRVYAHHGPQRLRGEALRDHTDHLDLIVTTYATTIRDVDDLSGISWGRVVLDEAQAIKNSLSQSSKAVRRLQAGHRVALTGTPVENRLAELWSIMDFLNPGMLGSSELFRSRYAIPVERHGLTEPAKRLRTITRPYVLRRLKTDPAIVDDLPDKVEVKQYCQLTTEQASLYQSVVDEMLERIEHSDGIERRGNVLAAMMKLKQVCNHPALLLHDRSAIGCRSGKVIRLEEILDEIIAEGDKVLCFTQFTEFAEMLLPHLAGRFGIDLAYLHGSTTRARRDELVARFQSEGGPPVFLLSLKAGGTGLNLTAANHVIHLDRWWNPAVEDQATDRAFRIGQKRNVQVRKFICTGTLEERIDDMIEDKKALADLVIRDGEGWLTELSTSDLRSVFALSDGAVGE